jgi:hypothetical protein
VTDDRVKRLVQAAQEAKAIARAAEAQKKSSLSRQEEKLANIAKRQLGR